MTYPHLHSRGPSALIVDDCGLKRLALPAPLDTPDLREPNAYGATAVPYDDPAAGDVIPSGDDGNIASDTGNDVDEGNLCRFTSTPCRIREPRAAAMMPALYIGVCV